MSTVIALDTQRQTPWQQEMSAVAEHLGSRLESTASAGDGTTLWLGGAYSELMPLCGSRVAGDVVVADSQPRRLRASREYLPGPAHMLQLVSLEDLRRDVPGTEAVVAGTVLYDADAYVALQEKLKHRFETQPAVADGGVDALVMDFALNRVSGGQVPVLLSEAFRVLARTGRVFCLVAMADEVLDGPQTLRDAPAGPGLHVPTEQAVLEAFDAAGFHGLKLHWSRAEGPLALDRIGDVDVRICLVEAYKGKQGPCLELGQAVVYSGPWREVHDDDGHVYRRGERVAVCAKTYDLLMREPYRGALMGLRSRSEPPLSLAAPFDCNTPALRSPAVTKGLAAFAGAQGPSGCVPGEGCC